MYLTHTHTCTHVYIHAHVCTQELDLEMCFSKDGRRGQK